MDSLQVIDKRAILGEDVAIMHTIDQNTQEWLDLRRPRITASNFAAFFMGKDTKGFKSAVTEIALGRLGIKMNDGFKGSLATSEGHRNEPIGKDYYTEITLDIIEEGNFWTRGDWAGASPDGLINSNGIWEHKAKTTPHTLLTAIRDYEGGVRLTEKSNKAHWWQVHFQLYVTGKEWCDYQFGYEGFRPVIQRIKRDESVIERIEAKLLEVIPIIEEEMKLYLEYMM